MTRRKRQTAPATRRSPGVHVHMQRALELAARARGRTHPNPMVGAVVVRAGRVVGEGYHRRAGAPHAEVVALAVAGKKARGADLYVSLEPCGHQGRTPPCTEAIIASQVRRVVFGMRDPNPQVAGRGLRALRRAGIVVVGPVCPRAARAVNPVYCHWRATQRPYVVLKVGTTLDGKIADRHGNARWITNAQTRRYTHAWRAQVDAMLVGRTTVLRDDPRLTVRLPGYRGAQPVPIIWVGRHAIPWRSRLLRGTRPVWCVVSTKRPADARRLAARGHRLIVAQRVPTLLHKLGQAGIAALMVEGGSATIGAFLRGRLVDRVVCCLAPKLLGQNALGWTDHISRALTTAPQIQVEKVHRCGDNVIIEGILRYIACSVAS